MQLGRRRSSWDIRLRDRSSCVGRIEQFPGVQAVVSTRWMGNHAGSSTFLPGACSAMPGLDVQLVAATPSSAQRASVWVQGRHCDLGRCAGASRCRWTVWLRSSGPSGWRNLVLTTATRKPLCTGVQGSSSAQTFGSTHRGTRDLNVGERSVTIKRWRLGRRGEGQWTRRRAHWPKWPVRPTRTAAQP